MAPVFPSIVDATVMPQIIRLSENLYAARFVLMKLLPAQFILARAAQDGVISRGSVIAESTSGTFGLALAMICSQRGYALTVVSDPVIDAALQRRLEDLGATVEIVQHPAPQGGYQRSRLDRLHHILSTRKHSFWPSQYDNPLNPAAYACVAESIATSIPHLNCLVGTVGSGGSLCGTLRDLRQRLAHPLTGVAVDTHGSVLFGQPDAGSRNLRGLGNSVMPANVDHRLIDSVHWVSAPEAFLATRLLHRRHAAFMGPTSGAAYMVASWLASRDRRASVLCLLPDEGHRYEATVYDDAWLRSKKFFLTNLPESPTEVPHPAAAGPSWSSMTWKRRSLEAAVHTAVKTRAEG